MKPHATRRRPAPALLVRALLVRAPRVTTPAAPRLPLTFPGVPGVVGTLGLLGTPLAALAQGGFDKVNTNVNNINTLLVSISIAVVTIAIIWAGFKMIFQGARLTDVANILIGGTLVGGAGAFAAYIAS